jgi:hypothetical protein
MKYKMIRVDGENPMPRMPDAAEALQIQLREAEAKLDEMYDLKVGLPGCAGEWISGSGGHRNHGARCANVATYWDPEDLWAYCDEHIKDHDKKTIAEAPWAYLVRKRQAAEAKLAEQAAEIERLKGDLAWRGRLQPTDRDGKPITQAGANRLMAEIDRLSDPKHLGGLTPQDCGEV